MVKMYFFTITEGGDGDKKDEKEDKSETKKEENTKDTWR